jgi:hypothetical protein
MDLHFSELFNIYHLDPATGELTEPGHNGVGRPGVISNNVWKLRWARAYWPATEVAWFMRYGRWPEGKVYTLDRNPFNVARGNLVMGALGLVNDARRIVWAAKAARRAVTPSVDCRGVHFEPAPRDRATFEQHQAEWRAEQAHCAGLGYPCPEFITWGTDYAHSPELDPLG